MRKIIGGGLALHWGLSPVHAISTADTVAGSLRFQFSMRSVSHGMSRTVRKFPNTYPASGSQMIRVSPTPPVEILVGLCGGATVGCTT